MSRVLPHDINAEKAILGAMLLSQKACDNVVERLVKSDFYLIEHQNIFGLMEELYNEHVNIDLVTLSSKMDNIEYLVEISGFVPMVNNINQYIDIVKSTSKRRQMIQSLTSSIDNCYEEDDFKQIADSVEQSVYEITDDTVKEIKSLSTIFNNMIDKIEIERLGDKSKQIKTHYTPIDNILGSLKRTEVSVVAARPSMGKTALALNIVHRICKYSDNKVLFISLEMADNELMQRLSSLQSSVDNSKIRKGNLNDEEFETLQNSGDEIGKYNLSINDNPLQTVNSIKSCIRKTKADIVFIDYLQLMSIKAENRLQEISKLTRSIKIMAKEMNVHIMLLSQLSRKCEERKNKKPILSDLRESGTIEQDKLTRLALCA